MEHPERDAEYQKPCAMLSKDDCDKHPQCYYNVKDVQCKRDATKLSNDEIQEMMNQTLRGLGFTDEQIRQNKIDYPIQVHSDPVYVPYVHSDNIPSPSQLTEFKLLNTNPSPAARSMGGKTNKKLCSRRRRSSKRKSKRKSKRRNHK
jgi:hypothetical protein